MDALMLGGPLDGLLFLRHDLDEVGYRLHLTVNPALRSKIVPDCNGEPSIADVVFYRLCDQGHWHFERWASSSDVMPEGRRPMACRAFEDFERGFRDYVRAPAGAPPETITIPQRRTTK